MDSSALRLRQAPISSPPSSLLNVLDICNRKKAAINGLRTSYIRKVSVIYTLLILWTEYLSLSLSLHTSLLNRYRFLLIFPFSFQEWKVGWGIRTEN
jgi:predicted AAA+ superfamily ATPase